MPEPRCVYFVADAHLGQGTPESNRARERDLLRFFDRVGEERAALYVNGDLFDFWFEYRHAIPKRFVSVLQALGDLRRRGLPVTYVGGNHDFWIGNYLTRELDVSFTDGALALSLQGRKIFLAHGDGLGPGDHGYKLLKGILRNPAARALYGWIHPDIGIPIASACSHSSRRHAPRPKRTDADLVELIARPRWREGFDSAVVGHLHRPLHHREPAGEFLILGDWIERRTYAKLCDGRFSLEEFTGEAATDGRSAPSVRRAGG